MAAKIEVGEETGLQDEGNEEGMEQGASDGSSLDSDGNSDDEESERKITELDQQLTQNPYLYDPHVQVIKLLRQAGEFDTLRAARERMHQIFPLTEELWLDWLQDEVRMISSDKDRETVNRLFERAVKDYLSVPVWLEYVQFSIGGMGLKDGIHTVRGVFEKALAAAGLHVTKGSALWEAYVEFENAVLAGLQPGIGAVVAKEQQEQIDSQTNRIMTLFRRQLAVPLQDMENTFVEYKEWCTDDIEPHVQHSYDKACTMLRALQPYEDKLLEADPPRLVEFQSYIEYELSQDNPSRIQCIFERALQENCLVPDLWLQYTKYLDNHLRIKDVILSVYERSVRNCPWSLYLWLGYVRALERHNESHDKIKETFDRAMGSGFTTGMEYLQLWQAYCDFLRRRIDWSKYQTDHKDRLKELRATFERAITHLIEYFPVDGDPGNLLQKYWARIEAKFCGNMEKSRELWNSLMAAGHGNEAHLWLEYYNLERSFGDHKHCRKILQRGINSASDWPESVCEAYIEFEREEGTLEQYDQAVERCEAQMARINERRTKAAEKEAALAGKKKEERKAAQKQKQQKQKQQQKDKDSPTKGEKRKHQEEETMEVSDFKVPDAPAKPAASAAKPKSAPPPGFKSKAPPPGFKSKAPPPGFKVKEEETAKEVEEPPVKKTKLETEEEAEQTESSRLAEAKPERTVFVSNLDFNSVYEDKLQEIFSQCGKVAEIRLVKNFKGKSKGYGYIEFVDELPVLEALKLDRTPVEGRPMYVSKFEEKSSKAAKFKFATSLEKTKLFVRGLPFTCTKEALQTIFGEHGPLKDVRLVTYRSGAPKGLAYIEYADEASASQAILKTDGLQIGEHTISVCISNPPERKTPLSQRDTDFTPTLGGGKKDFGVKGKARTQVSLVPRAVQRPAPSTSHSSGPAAPSSTATSNASKTSTATVQNGSGDATSPAKTDDTKLSNEDFRNMLLKR